MAPIFQQAPYHSPGRQVCPDCRMCQGCSPTRCQACRKGADRPIKRSFSEQIKRYEEINREECIRPDRPLRP